MMGDALSKRLNGVYPRLLSSPLDLSWEQDLSNKQQYGNLPLISNVAQM